MQVTRLELRFQVEKEEGAPEAIRSGSNPALGAPPGYRLCFDWVIWPPAAAALSGALAPAVFFRPNATLHSVVLEVEGQASEWRLAGLRAAVARDDELEFLLQLVGGIERRIEALVDLDPAHLARDLA
jgi:hypothetical protein